MTEPAATGPQDFAQSSSRGGSPGLAELFGHYLRTELAPSPGRFEAMLRTLITAVIVTIVSMALEVPLLSLSLFVIFMVNQPDYLRARTVALGIVATATLGAGLAILILKYTINDALFRILVCAAVVLACAFFQRVCKLGILFSLISLVVVFGQAAADEIPSGEAIVRLCLWAWVAVVYPSLVALAVNVWILPAKPSNQFAAAVCSQLARVRCALDAWRCDAPARRGIAPDRVPGAVLSLAQLQQSCAHEDASSLWAGESGLLLLSATEQSLAAMSRLRDFDVSPDVGEQRLIGDLVSQIDQIVSDLRHGRPLVPTSDWMQVFVSSASSDVVVDLLHAMQSLFGATRIPSSPDLVPEDPLILPDAWVNPAYFHIALKTVLSTYLCYVIYMGVDWPGIHTCMLTCIIVAVPGLGASTLKGALRVGGCLMGSLAALIATVFVIPHLDSITGLVLMVVPVVALSAWITAGSERISYAGLQVVFAFSLSVLDHFGPTTDLSEMRDRLVGVLLGVTVSALVNIYFWPDSNHAPLVRQARQLMDALNQFAHDCQAGLATGELAVRRLRLDVMIAQCQQELSERLLEPGQTIPERSLIAVRTKRWIADANELIQQLSRHLVVGTPPDGECSARLKRLNTGMETLTNTQPGMVGVVA